MARNGSKYENKYTKGQRFGSWEIVSPTVIQTAIRRTGYGDAALLCRCECGTERAVAIRSLETGKSLHCGCKKRTGDSNPNWKGSGQVSATYITQLSASVARTGTPFDVTTTYANNVMMLQDNICPYTGRRINTSDDSARLVPIETSGGYVTGNIQWVYTGIAPLVKKLPQQELIDVCKAVARKYQGQENDHSW